MKRTAGERCLASLAIALSCAAGVPVMAAPAVDALDRPALQVRRLNKSVLLAAAYAGSRAVAVGERGVVLLSDDDGKTWRQARSVPVSVTLTAIRFVDAQRGFATGHSGVVLSTSDGGETWVRRLDGAKAAQLALDDAKARGDAAAQKQAERLVADGADKPLLDLLLFTPQHIIVVGAYNLAFETTDAGASWKLLSPRLDNPEALHLYAVRGVGQSVVIAGEAGLVLRSDDGARSFRRVETPYKGSFFTLEMPNAAELVLAGLRGNAWQSHDGGASWSQLKTPVPASITGSALRSNAQGRAEPIFANQAGMLLAVRGPALVPLPGRPMPPLNGLLPLDGGGVLALSIGGALTVPPAPMGAPK